MIVKAAAKAAPAPIEVNGGLTLAKLIEASRMLDQNEVAEQGRYLFYAGEQMKELIANVDHLAPVGAGPGAAFGVGGTYAPAPAVFVEPIDLRLSCWRYVACSTARLAALFAVGGGVGVGTAGCAGDPPPPICC